MHRGALASFGIICLALVGIAPAGDQKPPKNGEADAPLLILDAQRKEVKLKGWHLTAGVRKLPIDGDAKKGPDYLEFREDTSTTYQNGILTLVPVGSVRKIDYDFDAKTVTAVVATAHDKDATLKGSIKFQGINRLTIEGDADLGELGFASVKFLGGNPKGGVTGIRFPNPKPAPDTKLFPAAVITGEDKDKTKHHVASLQAIYQQPNGSYQLSPTLYFKKTVKIDIGKIAALRHIESEDKKSTSYDFEVTLQGGDKHTLTMLTKVEQDGGKSMALAGLFGAVPVGYKLFPAHTILELQTEK